MMTLKCIIVDDEYVSRIGIKGYVDKMPGLECVGLAGDIGELKALLENEAPDIIFLDMEMPGMSGMDFLEQTSLLSCSIVVITAYARYALSGYDLNVTDYLLKPVSYSRFVTAVGKVRAYRASAMWGGVVTLKSDGMIYRVPVDDILYISAMENYLKVHTVSEKIIVRMTLKRMAEQLPSDKFVAVHRSFIVNVSKVSMADATEIKLVNGEVLPVSKNCRKSFFAKLTHEAGEAT
ncbi:MAG: LytTR family DNA-binding domain-containing protein [Muribaculum sp.]|nr:LytTR family DNA-binding domain-containing protein [Muribaculum sp.]